MATDPGVALEKLVLALREHLRVSTATSDPDADDVLDAAAEVADAFESYDEALYEATGVDTPLDVLDDEDDDEEDEDDEDLVDDDRD